MISHTWQNQKTWGEFLYRTGILGVLVVLSLFLDQGGLAVSVKDTLWQLLRPAWEGASYVAQQRDTWYDRWELFSRGASRLAQLEHERSRLQLQADRVALLERENALLRQELSNKQPESRRIFRFYGSGTEWFVDGGSQQGITVGQLVLQEGSFVGVVSTVTPNFSEVKTLWDESWQLPVKMSSGSAMVRGIYSRRRGIGEVQQVPRNFPVQTEMPVSTLGSVEVPPDLSLGRIIQVEENPDGATWNLTLEPYFSPSQLEWVEVQ